MRACVLNGTKMACYDSIKGLIVSKTGWSRGDVRCTFTSAVRQSHRHAGTRAALTDLVCSCYHSRWYPFQVCAGFFMTCTVAPFDMLRTTLMNQPTDRKIYNGYVCSRPRAAAGSVHPCCSWVHFRALLHVFFVCSRFSHRCVRLFGPRPGWIGSLTPPPRSSKSTALLLFTEASSPSGAVLHLKRHYNL